MICEAVRGSKIVLTACLAPLLRICFIVVPANHCCRCPPYAFAPHDLLRHTMHVSKQYCLAHRCLVSIARSARPSRRAAAELPTQLTLNVFLPLILIVGHSSISRLCLSKLTLSFDINGCLPTMASHRLAASASASSSSVLRCCAASSSSSSSSSSSPSQRGLHSSSRLSQAPVPQRTLPKSQAVAGTVPPKTIVEQIKAYPRHPLNAFFHFAPVADPSAGKDEEGKPKAAVMAPSVVTSTDLDTLSDASSTEGKMSARSWRAPELRRKSSLELHQLWYVLAMERNRLWTKVDEWRRAEVLENASRLGGTLQSRAHMVSIPALAMT